MHEIPGKETAPSQEQVQEELGENGPQLIEAMVALESASRQEGAEIANIRAKYSGIRQELHEVFNKYDQGRVDELYRRFQEAEVAYCSGCADMQAESDIETVLAIGYRTWSVSDCISEAYITAPAQELHQLCNDCRQNPGAKDKHLPKSDKQEGTQLFAAEISEEGLISYRNEDNTPETINATNINDCTFAEHEEKFRMFDQLPRNIKPWAEGIPPSIHTLRNLADVEYEHGYSYINKLHTPAADNMLRHLRDRFDQ